MTDLIPRSGLAADKAGNVVAFPGGISQPSANLRKVEAEPALPDVGVTTFAFVCGPLGIYAMKDGVRVKPDDGLLGLADCISQFHKAAKACARTGASNSNETDNETASTPGGLL